MEKTTMKLRLTIATLLVAVAGPAFAAEFYVAQNPTTKKCKVVAAMPDGQTNIMVGTSSYATKAEAKAAKKAAKKAGECKKPSGAAEFYVAQNPTTKKCKVVKAMPDGQTKIMVGTSSYATKAEAKAAKKAAAECKKPSGN
jgi:pyrroline-5-carboxylate reductase